jgi:transposase-like protein
LTLEEKKRLIEDIKQGLRLYVIAEKYNVNHKTVSYWRDKLKL